MGLRQPAIAAAAALFVVGATCTDTRTEEPTVVASFYPLAYAARELAGEGWTVVDLTPPGTEAHDVELSAEDRATIEEADVVLYLGETGFQPQVEQAVQDTRTRAVAVSTRFRRFDLSEDPHIWLDPILFSDVIAQMAVGMRRLDPAVTARVQNIDARMERLHDRYRRRLANCEYRTMIVSHEAFGYMARRYDLHQFGLAGLSPEGEPTSARVSQAHALIEDGQAGAVFYEQGEETQRIAESVADDAGVPALPLSTLESEPPEGDYATVMGDNLDSLREGLGCR